MIKRMNFEVESPSLFWCNLGAMGVEMMDRLNRMGENRPTFSSKWTDWTPFTQKYYIFEIARFEVQVLGEELLYGDLCREAPRQTMSGGFSYLFPVLVELL